MENKVPLTYACSNDLCVTDATYKTFSAESGQNKAMVNMSEETEPIEDTVRVPAKEELKQSKRSQASVQELVDSLRSVQEDIGQINELAIEERALAGEFFDSLAELVKPFASSIEVSTDMLAAEAIEAELANVSATGHLIVLHKEGNVELIDLRNEENRGLMIKVVEDIAPKFKQLTSTHKRKVENRIKFLSLVTKEMQKISKALSMSSDTTSNR